MYYCLTSSFFQLLLAAAGCDRPLHLSSTFNKLPSLSSILKRSNKPEAKTILESLTKTNGQVVAKEEPMDTTDCKNSDTSCDNFLFSKDSSEVHWCRSDDSHIVMFIQRSFTCVPGF